MQQTIGVLAFQGDFHRHLTVFEELGLAVRPVRRPEELAGLDGLVLPGGESTTIGKLIERFGLLAAIRDAAAAGLSVMGTCAGAILLSRGIVGSDQPRLGLLDTEIERNAYGRQVDSFEADIEVPALGPESLRGVFIRAPRYVACGPAVEVLARFEGAPVIIREGPHLALTFHPELTGDTRLHRYFVEMTRTTSC
ncbi:MAG: pyridoxal 5'-phosphate synthase glutaminase subunit PdxT [Spirochaeta sp.]|jgi:5'-phosphate synthase pdxT subunit|nr:pyridoxal 5'-phosphate synthase glutaminase subunit PdxT [Spirochaeta sp.]